MSALIYLREKLMNRKHNIIVFNALRTLFTLTSYLSIPRIYGICLIFLKIIIKFVCFFQQELLIYKYVHG